MREPLDILRELAKNDYYQSLYSSAKELGLQIFNNNTELTRIQLWFISFMGMYSMINMDIALGEVSDKVLENTTYEDAYLWWKKKSTGPEIKKKKNELTSPSNKTEKEVAPKSSWVFKRSKEK